MQKWSVLFVLMNAFLTINLVRILSITAIVSLEKDNLNGHIVMFSCQSVYAHMVMIYRFDCVNVLPREAVRISRTLPLTVVLRHVP